MECVVKKIKKAVLTSDMAYSVDKNSGSYANCQSAVAAPEQIGGCSW
jgi:hypothetical protein